MKKRAIGKNIVYSIKKLPNSFLYQKLKTAKLEFTVRELFQLHKIKRN